MQAWPEVSGLLLYFVAAALIADLDPAPLTAASAWLLLAILAVFDLRRWRGRGGPISGLQLAPDGSLRIFRPGQRPADGRLLAGCRVVGPFAWLRLHSEVTGARSVLIRAKANKINDWRRLRVIIRFLGARRGS